MEMDMEVTENRFSRLGFVPQKELVYSKLLPYWDKLDAESVSNLAIIKSKLGESVIKRELRPAFSHWLFALCRYIEMYGLKMPKEDHLTFIRTLYEMCVHPDTDFAVVSRVANALAGLLKKKELLSRKDLVIDWKPLFALYERVTDNRYQRHRVIIVPSSVANMVRNLVRACRVYFSDESTKEMLDLWSPLVCPYLKVSTQKAMTNFQLFLPTLLPPESHSVGFQLWLDEFLDFWQSFETAPAWETYLMWLFSRLAQDNIGYIDWEPYIPRIFSRLLRSFQLPSGFNAAKLPWPNDSFDITAAANLVTALLGGGSGCQRHLDTLFNVLESYCHPSNIGMWNLKVNKFLSKLPETVVKRLHRERSDEKTWMTAVPSSRRLTEEDVTSFVKGMMDCVLLSMFGKMGCFDAALALKNLAILRPDIAIPPLLDRLYPALETLTEPHRLTATLQCVTCTVRELAKGGEALPQGPSHVLPILSCCLPGIDPNDFKKSLVTFQLIEHVATLVPIVDCSQAIQFHPDLTDREQELCLDTRGFEDFVLNFLDRCFVVIESMSTEPPTHETEEDALMNPEEKVLQQAMVATFNTVINQCSPEIYKATMEKLRAFVTGRIFGRGAAGKTVAKLCGAATIRDNPEEGLRAFVPHVCWLVLALTDSEDVTNEKRLGDELLFNLLLLSELVSGDGKFLLPYKDRLLEVLGRTVWLSSREGHGVACSILSNLMVSLTVIYFTEQRSVPWSLDRPLSQHLPIKDWGLAGDVENLNVSWHVPSAPEVELAQELVDEFLGSAVDRLDSFCSGKLTMTRDEVQHCLMVLHHGLKGALALCPLFEGPPEKLIESTVGDASGLSCTISADEHELTLGGKHVRETVADTMHRLTRHLLDNYEDNTGAFKSILKIYGLLVFYRGVDTEEYPRRLKGFQSIKKVLKDELTGKKRHLRSLLLQRVQLLHELRVIDNGQVRMTVTAGTIVKDLVGLSVSRYREVRITAQKLLQDCVNFYPYSYLMVLPMVMPFLRKDPAVTEVQLKGALHLVMGQQHRGLLLKHDWKVLAQLWPAILSIQHYEKPSTSRLLDALVAKISKGYQTFAIGKTVPETAMEHAKALWSSAPTPCSPIPTAEEEEEGARLLKVDSEENFRNYSRLVSSLTDLMTDGGLKWQNFQLCFTVAGYLMRHDEELPAPMVRCFLGGLVHEALAVRKLALVSAVGVLMVQKPEYVRRRVDLGQEAGPSRPQKGFLTRYREDNEWLQYDEAVRYRDADQWERENFVHKQYFGFSSWPTPLEVYAAASEQPPLDRDPTTLSQAEEAVYRFFSDSGNVDRLMGFLTLEDQKGKDKFSVWKSTLFKGLFRNFGDTFLREFVPHLQKLVEDPKESSQRCAAEIICGLARGGKRWPFDKVSALWEQVLTPLWRTGLSNVTEETKADWSYCVGLVVSHIDPRSIPWLLELLSKGLLVPDNCEGSFLEASRIRMMCSALENLSWRTARFAVSIVERARPFLAQPYQNIRKDLSRLLAAVFKLDLDLSNGSRVPGPKVETFVSDTVMPLLQRFYEEEAPSNGTGNGDFQDQKWKDEVAVLKTVSGWISHHAKKCPQMRTEAFVPLVPMLMRGEGMDQDPELQRECLNAVALVSQTSLEEKDLEAVMKVVSQVGSAASWRMRRTVLHFVRVLVFSNLFTVVRCPWFVRDLGLLVLRLLEDPRIEVREMTAVTLSGLLHCRVITDSDEVYGEFERSVNRWAKTKIKGISSNVAEYQTALVTRHAGVLGLCALVKAHPYDICDGMPRILMTIADHLRDPQPIQTTVRTTLSDFWRTHHDCWQQHKQKFTDEQLEVLTDLLVSPNYYA